MRRALAVAVCGALAVCASPAPAATPWRAVGPPAPLQAIAFSPSAGSSRVYAQTRSALWRSGDDGATWTQTSRLPDTTGCALRASPVDPGTVYSGCSWLSSDSGDHWHYVAALTAAPQIDAAGSLYISDRFQHPDLITRCAPDVTACVPVVHDNAWTAVVDPASQGLLAEAGASGATVSADGGSVWSQGTWPAGTRGSAVWFDGRVPRKLYMTGDNVNGDRLFAVSLDAGLSWGPARAMPFAPADIGVVVAGGSGAQRRVWILGGADAAWTADDGVSFHVVHLPTGGTLTVDPGDGTHLLVGNQDLLYESRDGGATWVVRNSPAFGHLTYQAFTGSGSTLYALADYLVWFSGDAGASWAPAATLGDAHVTALMASRDHPAVAYAAGATVWQTVDGGRNWAARAAVPLMSAGRSIAWVESGNPQLIIGGSLGSLPYYVSRDGGATWSELPADELCTAGANGVPSSPPCGAFPVDPTRAPWDQAYVAAWGVLLDHTGGGSMVTLDPLGHINADWSFTSACTTSKPAAPCPFVNSLAHAQQDAWAGEGHITFATSDGQSVFAERDGGRWWRLLAPPGSDAEVGPGPVVLLSNTALVASGLLIPLQAPDVGVPALSLVSGPLHCGVSLPSDAADLAYVWHRDGAVIAGTTADHTIVPADEGHALGCTVTASNAWGSSTAASVAYRVSVTGAAGRRLSLKGAAFATGVLRCGATKRITWLRDGHTIKGQHARSYRVRAGDEGHALACRGLDAGGALATSVSRRVPKARGGRALPVVLTP